MTEEQEKTPQQMAAEVIRAHFDADDAETTAVIDQLAAALDEFGLLIDPVDNGMWQNLKRGDMTCSYKDGGLMFRLTEQGTESAKRLITELASDGSDDK
jgi:hypothetical protein